MDGPLGGAPDPRSAGSERGLINRQIGPYRIRNLLGKGGMGEVYRARDTKLQRDVAIKVLPAAFTSRPDRLARFEREARVLASVNHPNIGGIYGFEESDGVCALALELVDGATLADLVAAGPLPIKKALTAARDIANALEAAHEKGIVHRDLKPSNIMITETGAAKVLDFGIAKVFADDSADPDGFAGSLTTVEGTREGVILGTVAYMSPEQARGKPLDKRTDIWAFGCVVYELLAGREVFGRRESSSEIVAAILEREPDWRALPEATPQIVRRLLRRCLEKDPRQRLHDIGDARLDLEEALSTHGTDSPTADIVVAGHPPIWKTRMAQVGLLGLAALGLAAAISVAMLYFTGRLSGSGEPVETRFQVLPPPGATFDGSHALSPDGRWLVFVASSQGQALLWLRPRDSVVAQPLNGTSGARSPFWSPDSRAIAFFAAGKLRTITVPDGIPQTIADAANPNSGTWNRDDVIIFVPSDEGGLYRIAATGGEPTRIATVDRAGQPLLPHFPCFLPDDHRFLYYGVSPHPERSGIYVGSLDGGPSDLVLSTNLTKVVYTPPGYLLFARERALVAQAFDERDLKLVGKPFQPAGITYDESNGASFSTSGTGALAFWAGQLRNGQIVVFDRSGSRLRQFGQPGDYAAPSLSPDQSQLAVERLGEERHTIWLIDWQRQVPSGFATYAWGVHHPVWSPDGHWIAYTDGQSLHRKAVAADASDERLTSSTGVVRPTDWRGNVLVYEQAAPGTAWDIWYLPLAGPRKPLPFLRTAASEVQGHLSPNGQSLAYTSDESVTLEVYARSFPSGGDKLRVSTNGGAQPKWRNDGKEIFYLSADRRLMAVEVRSQSPLVLGAPKPLFPTGISGSIAISPSSNNNYAVTSDGQRFFVNTSIEQQNIAPITVVLNWTRSLRQ
jgi:eukaryotic-like serine/threonine-protein kinase